MAKSSCALTVLETGGRSSRHTARLLQICKVLNLLQTTAFSQQLVLFADTVRWQAAEESYPELEKLVQEKSTGGSETPMKVSFRDINTFNLWVRRSVNQFLFLPGQRDRL